MEREVLAAPRAALDAGPGDAFSEGGLVGAFDDGDGLARVGRDADACYTPPDKARLEVAPYRLDFGQLRHGLEDMIADERGGLTAIVLTQRLTINLPRLRVS